MMSSAARKYDLRSKTNEGFAGPQGGLFGGVLCWNGNCEGCLMTHPASHIVWKREWANEPPYGINQINRDENNTASPNLGSHTPEVLSVATPECSAEDTLVTNDDDEKEVGISLDTISDDSIPAIMQTPRQRQIKSIAASLVVDSRPSPAPLAFNQLMTPVSTRRITKLQQEDETTLKPAANEPPCTNGKNVPEELHVELPREEVKECKITLCIPKEISLPEEAAPPPSAKPKRKKRKVSSSTSSTLKQHDKTAKRIRHIRRDQKIMKRQLHDIEVKLEVMESDGSRSETAPSTLHTCDRSSQTNATADVMPAAGTSTTEENPTERINQLLMLVSELEGKNEMQTSSLWYNETQVEQLRQQVTDLLTEKQRQDQRVKELESKLSAEKKNNVSLRAELEKVEKKSSAPPRKAKPPQITDPDPRQPAPKSDVLFLHDSLGKGIHDTILKNENLGTEKALTYTLDDATKNIKDRTSIPHRAVAIHVGTNDLVRHRPEEIVTKMEELVKTIVTKAPNTQVVISSIVTRTDSKRRSSGKDLKPELEYVNAAIKLKLANNSKVSIVSNDNIGEAYLSTDFLHLDKSGTSRLASNIKKCVAKALNIPLVKRQR